uniref:Tryptophan-associated membrane protein n=1 Tax=uncultured bacterium esnapd12 TaxID=1366592 RepID=S5UCK1_9BACT|nr:tryptophan-associated membrane protein [uncultured bacterium esnapd12]
MTVRLAQAMLVLAAAGLWVASRLPWVAVRSSDGLGQPRTVTVNGASWSTALVPMAVLLLAAALATLAVRGWPLRLLAVLVAVVAGGAGYLAITLWTLRDVAVRGALLAQVPVTSLVASQRHSAGAAVALAAAIGALGGAALLMRVAAKASVERTKYVSPAQRRACAAAGDSTQTVTERMMWDAIDEGRDPTGNSNPDSNTEGR